MLTCDVSVAASAHRCHRMLLHSTYQFGSIGRPVDLHAHVQRNSGLKMSSARAHDISRASAGEPWTRDDTPGVRHAAHFNAAGAALPTAQTLQAGFDFLQAEATIGGYEATEAHADLLRLPYDTLAQMISCSPDEIAIVESATTAWQQAFFGIDFKKGDRVLTSQHEYGTNFINYLQAQRRFGIVIEVVPETEDFDIDTAALEEMIQDGPRPKLIAITHIATNSGRVYSAAAVGKVAREYGVPYLLDACQSIGQLPLDVRELGCDWLSGTARKYLRGLRGAGFLYASSDVMARTEPAMLDMRGAEWSAPGAYTLQPTARRYEQYEISFATKAALGVAAQQALDIGLEAIWGRIRFLADTLRQGLREVPGVTVLDKGRLLCGIVSWDKERVSAAEVRRRFQQDFGVHVWVSPLTSTRIDMSARGLTTVVRSSLHYYNTEGEIERLLEAARQL